MGSLNNSPMVAESGHKKNVIDEKRSAATGGGGGKAYVDSRAELQKPVIEVRGRPGDPRRPPRVFVIIRREIRGADATKVSREPQVCSSVTLGPNPYVPARVA